MRYIRSNLSSSGEFRNSPEDFLKKISPENNNIIWKGWYNY